MKDYIQMYNISFYKSKKLLEYYERQKPQVHTKFHVQRSLVLKLSKPKKYIGY